jgi:molecular chaperone GrpE
MAERTEDAQAMGEAAQQEQQEQRQDGAQATADGQGQGKGADLEAQLEAARAEAADYKDRFLRERAEMENFRKRQERIAADRMQRFKRDLFEKVLEVTDNLDRAMQYEATMDANSLRQTLRMLQSQLNAVLAAEGLTPVATVGQPFDPYIHEAIETVSSPEHPEGAVVDEVRKGYTLGGDLIRPARVTVSSGAKE